MKPEPNFELHFFFSVKGRNGELNKNYPTMHFSSVFGQF